MEVGQNPNPSKIVPEPSVPGGRFQPFLADPQRPKTSQSVTRRGGGGDTPGFYIMAGADPPEARTSYIDPWDNPEAME